MQFHTACPNCGADTVFQSAASVFAVCRYCQSVVHRDSSQAHELGKVGILLEDYSPIQIGTAGTYNNARFTVIGRTQLRYEAGLWNEWLILFDNGSQAWLGDASGQYMITTQVEIPSQPPGFEELKIDSTFIYEGKLYIVTDVREAKCTGGEGELPFAVDQAYTAKVADLRCGNKFITLDYSHKAVELYKGQAVELSDLKCDFLRDNDAIQKSAGRLKGDIGSLDCPSCGHALNYFSGIATQLSCPTCAASIDASGDKALLIRANEQSIPIHASKRVGTIARIRNIEWTVIGLLERQDCKTRNVWAEYLLYNPKNGFLWLVESADGWFESKVLNTHPFDNLKNSINYHGVSYNSSETYEAIVRYAAGAFNWRAQIGDITIVKEYVNNNRYLTKEQSDKEATWSLSKKVSYNTIETWFAKEPIQTSVINKNSTQIRNEYKDFAWGAATNTGIINFFLCVFGTPFIVFAISSLVASALLALPLLFPGMFNQSSDS